MRDYDHLPKFVDYQKVDIPYCEDCFVNAHYAEQNPDPLAFIFDWSTGDDYAEAEG